MTNMEIYMEIKSYPVAILLVSLMTSAQAETTSITTGNSIFNWFNISACSIFILVHTETELSSPAFKR